MSQNVGRQALDRENSFLLSTLEKGAHLVSDLGTEFGHETEKISSLKIRFAYEIKRGARTNNTYR